MGESLSVPIPIDGDPVRGEILLEKSVQRGLQRGAEARDSFAVPLLPIATRRPSSRRVRDPQGDHPRDGIVSICVSHPSLIESDRTLNFAAPPEAICRRSSTAIWCPSKVTWCTL